MMATVNISELRANAGKWVIFNPATTFKHFTDNVEAAKEEYMNAYGEATNPDEVTLFRIPDIVYEIKRSTEDVAQITEAP